MAKAKGKKWFLSKTLWFNLLTIALGVVDVVSGVYVINPEYIALINGVGNVLLRIVTTEPVKLK